MFRFQQRTTLNCLRVRNIKKFPKSDIYHNHHLIRNHASPATTAAAAATAAEIAASTAKLSHLASPFITIPIIGIGAIFGVTWKYWKNSSLRQQADDAIRKSGNIVDFAVLFNENESDNTSSFTNDIESIIPANLIESQIESNNLYHMIIKVNLVVVQ